MARSNDDEHGEANRQMEADGEVELAMRRLKKRRSKWDSKVTLSLELTAVESRSGVESRVERAEGVEGVGREG